MRESLEVEFPAQGDRFWRIAIVDGNDAPIEDLDLTLLRPVQSIVFRPVRGRSYRLLYGNSSARVPDYELSDLLDFEQRHAAPIGSLGEQLRNENFVSSWPFTERHPELLWAALILTVFVVGVLALRSLR